MFIHEEAGLSLLNEENVFEWNDSVLLEGVVFLLLVSEDGSLLAVDGHIPLSHAGEKVAHFIDGSPDVGSHVVESLRLLLGGFGRKALLEFPGNFFFLGLEVWDGFVLVLMVIIFGPEFLVSLFDQNLLDLGVRDHFERIQAVVVLQVRVSSVLHE